MTRTHEGASACRTCVSFEAGAQVLERALPALAALSSAHGASRSDDGLCRTSDRCVPATARCAGYRAQRSHHG